ncbi:MAG: dCTP deaminase [Candidatus Tectomicrobia bacterium]|nr:dCTP deaminase [Candidatus Tectomicrobia bacterium]
MILSQRDLRDEVAAGRVVFDPPLEEKQWGEASVDLRLGFSFTKIKNAPGVRVSVAEGLGTIGGTGLWITQVLKERDEFGKRNTFSLGPNEFVLALTYETIRVPNHLIAMVQGRSTYARVGISMHQTAPWVQPGWSGPIVLEIVNIGPLHIDLTPAVDRPCQLTFFRLTSELPPEAAYGSRASDVYQDQKHPLLPTSKPREK